MFFLDKKISILLILIFAAGFLSVVSGFYLDLGYFKFRIYDIGFIFISFMFLVRLSSGKFLSSLKIYSPLFISFVIVSYPLILIFPNSYYSDAYYSYSIIFFLNKILPFIIYVMFFALYGIRCSLLFFKGFIIGSLFSCFYMFAEFLYFMDSSAFLLNQLGPIHIDEKKFDIINQGFIRPSGFSIDTNYLAAYAGLSFFLVDRALPESKLIFRLLLKFIFLASVLLLFSRTAISGFVVCLICSLFFSRQNLINRIFGFLVVLVLTILLLLYIYFYLPPDFFDSVLARIFFSDSSAQTRLGYLTDYLFVSSPFHIIFGNGTISSGFILSNSFSSIEDIWAPESTYLSFFIDYGVIYLLFLLFISFIILFRLFKNNNDLWLAWLFFIVVNFFYNFSGDRLYFMFFAFVLYSSFISSSVKFSFNSTERYSDELSN